jgi:hypothetical protein
MSYLADELNQRLFNPECSTHLCLKFTFTLKIEAKNGWPCLRRNSQSELKCYEDLKT